MAAEHIWDVGPGVPWKCAVVQGTCAVWNEKFHGLWCSPSTTMSTRLPASLTTRVAQLDFRARLIRDVAFRACQESRQKASIVRPKMKG